VKPVRSWQRRFTGVALFLVLAFLVGRGVQQLGARFAARPEPAGFARGVVQGALMPMALPNLILGRDVIIYAERNTGVGYKLGYTLGVNVCGLIFFGFFFRRRQRRNRGGSAAP
jgi:hypothetical protein